jgi:hypothetical protein
MPVNSEAAGMPDRSEAAEKTERQEPAAQARLPVNGARDVLTSEAPENYAETPPAGEAVVLAAQEFAETPPAMKQLLREQPQAAAAAMENKTAFGQKLKKIWGAVRPALAGFAAGAAAKAGIKFFAMRALDYGSVGASALAGGAVGGGLEFYKAYKGETKRLYDLETYNRTLDGYERMTDMEKVKAYAVIENALKDKNLNPAQNAELSAKMAPIKYKCC